MLLPFKQSDKTRNVAPVVLDTHTEIQYMHLLHCDSVIVRASDLVWIQGHSSVCSVQVLMGLQKCSSVTTAHAVGRAAGYSHWLLLRPSFSSTGSYIPSISSASKSQGAGFGPLFGSWALSL